MNKAVILTIIGMASLGMGMVLAQKMIQPQATFQDGSDHLAAQEVFQPQAAFPSATTQPAVQRFPQLGGGCCGGSAVQNTATQLAAQKSPQWGGCCGGRPTIQNTAAQGIQVGNRICPVSGRPIGTMGPGVEETYKGKIYHLCCGGCIGIFESDPERYSKIADDEVKGQGQ